MTRRISPRASEVDPLSDNARTGPLWVWPVLALALLLAAWAGGGDEDARTSATRSAERQLTTVVTGHWPGQPQFGSWNRWRMS